MYLLYKTTNTLNGKYYVGVSNGNDIWYKGSGTALKRAIKKYGSKSFVTETLETFDNADAAFKREEEVVNETFVADHNTYNMKVGGKGGKGQKKSKEHRAKISKSVKAKWASGTVSGNGGRKPAMDRSVLLATVKEHGLIASAKILNVDYSLLRDRYYRAKATQK